MEIQPLIEGEYFHIYNRGVNKENIFKETRNYYYFLKQYKKYCSNILETLAYSLLKNHFHLLVYVKENVFVPRTSGEGIIRLNAAKQLSHFFNSYAQSINTAYNRSGPLFESPFERKLITDDQYITSLIYYCHFNPQLHGFVENFKHWEFSSYHSILKNDNPIVNSEKVLNWFGGKTPFEKMHQSRYGSTTFEKFIIE